MQDTRIRDILYRYLREGTLSPGDQDLLNQWMDKSEDNRNLLDQLSDEEQWQEYFSLRMNTGKTDRAFERFVSARNQKAVVRSMPTRWKWGWAAAAILVVFASSVYFFLDKAVEPSAPALVQQPADIAPGMEGAILTLADGSTVVLDSLGNGIVAAQIGAQAVIRNGELMYEATGEPVEKISYNTLHTPKGRQFALTLSDGTKVWLNAASSIRYPANFAGKERWVDITGEVYFEVAASSQTPFRINVDGRAMIDVLGTDLNVNAYANEAYIRTTLINGAVRVAAGQSTRASEAVVLKPGQQAQLSTDGGIKLVKDADIEKVIAWKDGLFNFDGATLEEVMKQLERWYDIEVIYEQGVPDKKLIGKMTRGLTLNGLMIGLKELGIRTRLEGRQLIVEH